MIVNKEVIETSGGGVEAFKTLLSGLPKDLPTAVFAAMHHLLLEPHERIALWHGPKETIIG